MTCRNLRFLQFASGIYLAISAGRAHLCMGIESYEQLEAWRMAHQAVLETYRLTAGFPPIESTRLADQMCRAGISIAGNIAEGFGRRRPKDKIRFYNSSRSINELRYFYLLARDLHYLEDTSEVVAMLDSTARMLKSLIRSIEGTAPPQAAPEEFA